MDATSNEKAWKAVDKMFAELDATGEVINDMDDEQLAELRAAVARRTDQAWYWTPEWQAGERQADEDLREGRFRIVRSAKELFAR